ncbi:transposase [Methanocella paludicola]|nr:transposase [Methanocella paludicola]
MKTPYSPRVCSVRHVDINLFARRFAEWFDFPRNREYARCLANASVRRTSLESVYDNYGGLPPDSFFLSFKYPVETVISAMDWFFECQAGLLDLHGCTVAIDLNDVEYWGRVDEYVHPKKGLTKNTYVLRYAVASMVDEKRKLALACMPISTNDKLVDIVRILLEKAMSHVLVDVVLFDRGFYNATLLKTVEEMGVDYVIPLRKSKGTDRVWEESKKNGECKLRHTVKGETDQISAWLYLDEKKKENKEEVDRKETGKRKGQNKNKNKNRKKRKEREYVGVISNMDVRPELVEDFMDWYFVRNNVETGFKEKNQYKIRTCSTDKAYRFLIYCISLYLMNLVQVVRIVNNTFFRNDEMKKLVILLLILDKPLVGEHRLSRTLIVIA